MILLTLSHPAWGAWIEIELSNAVLVGTASHPAWGAWIEIYDDLKTQMKAYLSHPAWGAWIEILRTMKGTILVMVAPRMGCVD